MMLFLSKVWAFIKSPVGQCLGLALVVFLLLWGINRAGYASGVRHELAKEAQAQAAAAAKVGALNHQLAVLGDKSRADLAAAQAVVEVRTQTLIRKVPVYVTSKADAACVVPAGFISLWNHGASGQAGLPPTSGGPVEAPSGLRLSDVLAATLANDGIAYDWKAEALAWRGWYPQAKAKWDALP
jgi:hypothetical protein